MLSKELRIGNYVNSPVFFFDDSVMHVIRAEDIVEQVNIEKSGGVGFEPIPLTDEWIKDFGLDKHEFVNVFSIKNEKKIYRIMINGHIVGDSIYVHHLQNLWFFWAYNELKIK